MPRVSPGQNDKSIDLSPEGFAGGGGEFAPLLAAGGGDVGLAVEQHFADGCFLDLRRFDFARSDSGEQIAGPFRRGWRAVLGRCRGAFRATQEKPSDLAANLGGGIRLHGGEGGQAEGVVAGTYRQARAKSARIRAFEGGEDGDQLLAFGGVGFFVGDGLQGFGHGGWIATAEAQRGGGIPRFGQGQRKLIRQGADGATVEGGFKAGEQLAGGFAVGSPFEQFGAGEQVLPFAGGGEAAHQAFEQMLPDERLLPEGFVGEERQHGVAILFRVRFDPHQMRSGRWMSAASSLRAESLARIDKP